MLRVRSDVLHIAADGVQLSALFMHDMRYVPEQLIQLPDTLFNIPDLRFSLYDKRFLEVDFVL